MKKQRPVVGLEVNISAATRDQAERLYEMVESDDGFRECISQLIGEAVTEQMEKRTGTKAEYSASLGISGREKIFRFFGNPSAYE